MKVAFLSFLKEGASCLFLGELAAVFDDEFDVTIKEINSYEYIVYAMKNV